jgi:hypothetical protein
MTRQHFVRSDLAACLHAAKPKLQSFDSSNAYHAAYDMWADSCAGISAVCEQCTLNFNRLQFLAACTNGA